MRAKIQTGFTLIELLVAVTILAIVAVLGWRGLDGIVRARIGLTAEMEQTRGIQLAFAQLENDCAHLADSDLLAGRDGLSAADSRLLMIRTVFDENQPTRLQVVAYRVVDGVLSRRESDATRDLVALDKDWLSAMSEADTTASVPLQTEVNAFNLRTWSEGEGAWRIGGSEGPAKSQAGGGQKIGLEVSLQMRGREQALTKVFLLGAT
ncbi:MAG: prepilin-type N-terminal cleavage/methylation domain-containing protein [Burkholderiales bacterium]|nr:prepilin-type N-terminal cleavage/methylation domain-containing protein [Burkholderiales bacterium]